MPELLFIALIVLIVFAVIWLKRLVRNRAIKKAGNQGESIFRDRIKNILDDDDILLNNVEIKVDDLRTEIDSLIINKNGIFIVEVKNYNGRLYGNIDDYEWVKIKTSPGGNEFSKTVRNPFKQVNRHIFVLSRLLKKHNLKIWIKGYVYFVNDNSPVDDECIINDEYELEQIIHEGQDKAYDKSVIQKAVKLLK